MSDDNFDQKLISIFAAGQVWVSAEVVQKLLASENLQGWPGDKVIEALSITFKYIEDQTIVSISDKMFDSLEEE